LEKHGLVEHEPYRGVKLTTKGERLALDILRRHRLAERLLTDILKAEWSDVHESACKLEHALTKDVIALLEKRLGSPRVCPHGNPIPTKNGEMEEEECYPLTEISLNMVYRVAKITNEKQEKLLTLANRGLKPDTLVQVLEKNSKKMVLNVNGRKRVLTHDEASNVWVRSAKVNKHAVQT
jgi:DtxR family Mn-dependent transcriptional regulator